MRYPPRPISRRTAQTYDFTRAKAMMPELQRAHAAVDEIIPSLADVRRRYAASRSDADRAEHDRVQADADRRFAEFQEALRRVQEATGLPPEAFDEMSAIELTGDRTDRRQRSALTVDEVQPTGCLDDFLSTAIGALVARLPPGWLGEEPAELFPLPTEPADRPVSIVKGFRPESEKPAGHRLRQMVQVSRDYLAGDSRYDHFAGALLVPQLARLGSRLGILDRVPGAEERIANLWKKPGEVDNTVYELLVAAALAEAGRIPSFIPEGQGKTPDIRCNDPFPLVVECKRRAALSEYELAEEAAMRRVFVRLREEALRRGACGVFDLDLRVEADAVGVEEIVARCIQQRLASKPRKPLDHAWGSVAFHARPRLLTLPGPTKAYSPRLLRHAFGWNEDVPSHDGLICQADCAEGAVVEDVRDGVALRWTNRTAEVAEKRSRPPTSLFGKATGQMPGGEFGIVYICYPEGARAEIADRRVELIAERLKEWQHSATFRIPLVYLSRVYPRALDAGQPDIIESAISYLSEPSGGDPWMLEQYPGCVFTATG